MVKRKTKDLDPFTGTVTPKMLALWAMSSLPGAYELRLQIATLQFYFKSTINDGKRVIGTEALAITEDIANKYFA